MTTTLLIPYPLFRDYREPGGGASFVEERCWLVQVGTNVAKPRA
jgi:hypothetical protein